MAVFFVIQGQKKVFKYPWVFAKCLSITVVQPRNGPWVEMSLSDIIINKHVLLTLVQTNLLPTVNVCLVCCIDCGWSQCTASYISLSGASIGSTNRCKAYPVILKLIIFWRCYLIDCGVLLEVAVLTEPWISLKGGGDQLVEPYCWRHTDWYANRGHWLGSGVRYSIFT